MIDKFGPPSESTVPAAIAGKRAIGTGSHPDDVSHRTPRSFVSSLTGADRTMTYTVSSDSERRNYYRLSVTSEWALLMEAYSDRCAALIRADNLRCSKPSEAWVMECRIPL